MTKKQDDKFASLGKVYFLHCEFGIFTFVSELPLLDLTLKGAKYEV